MKKLMTLILQDSPIEPCGGLGERYKNLIPFLEKEFDLEIFNCGKGGKLSNTPCFDVIDDNFYGLSNGFL